MFSRLPFPLKSVVVGAGIVVVGTVVRWLFF